jgi:acyl carrier protein
VNAPALRQRLVGFLLATGRVREADLAADAPLITSGLVNSVALFGLAVWIEEEIGHPVEITAVDLPGEWDTMGAILAFIERHRAPDGDA